jgi:tetratricopeptide (TPR) repeat protein
MKDILDDRLTQLETLQSELGKTPTLDHAIGLTHQHLGRWYKTDPEFNSSQKKKTLMSYAQALKIAEGLEEYPEDKGIVLVRIGDLHKLTGNYELALQNYVGAMPYLRGDNSKNNEWLSKAKSNLVDVYEKLDRTEESFALALEIVHDTRVDLEESPQDISIQRRLANRLQRLASTYSKNSTLQEAVETQKEAIGLYVAIATENPTTRSDIDIAWAQYFLGKYHIMNDQHAEGLSAFDAGLNVLEQCAAEFPDSKEVHRAIQDYTKGRDNWIEHLKNVS